MNLATRLFCSILLSALTPCLLFGQQMLYGQVLDHKKDPIIGGNVIIFKGDAFITGTATDFDGNYSIHLDPGEYDIEFSYVGQINSRIQGVQIPEATKTKLDFKFSNEPLNLEVRSGRSCGRPIIRVDETTQGMTIYTDEIRRVSKPN